MTKDLQTIIKEAAERYGLGYNEQQQQPTITRKDGTINVISRADFHKAFGLDAPETQDKWTKVLESVTWVNNYTNEFTFTETEDFHIYKYDEEKIIA